MMRRNDVQLKGGSTTTAGFTARRLHRRRTCAWTGYLTPGARGFQDLGFHFFVFTVLFLLVFGCWVSGSVACTGSTSALRGFSVEFKLFCMLPNIFLHCIAIQNYFSTLRHPISQKLSSGICENASPVLAFVPCRTFRVGLVLEMILNTLVNIRTYSYHLY